VLNPYRHVYRLAVTLGCNSEFLEPLVITDQIGMLPLMRQNITINNLTDTVAAVVYDWGEPKPRALPDQLDIILAADCVYFEPAFPLLQKTLLDLIGENTVCYFCFKKRRRADLHFVKVIRKLFDVKEVLDDLDKATYSKENIYLCVGSVWIFEHADSSPSRLEIRKKSN
jgi:hypothetical protein